MWQAEKTPDAQGRVENLRELVRAMGEFEALGDFLEHVSLVTSMDENAAGDMISIMTLHAAKGLEFEHVFLPGWEEGLFPHQRALDESGASGLEEERRLAYVGMTRARKLLTISFAANRRVYNQWQSSIPSRFISELPDAYIERLDGGAYGQRSPMVDMRKEVAKIMSGVEKPSPLGRGLGEGKTEGYRSHLPHPGPLPKGEGVFAVNTRIFHQKFGYGRIIRAEGEHLEIAFEKAGVKKVMKDYVEKA